MSFMAILVVEIENQVEICLKLNQFWNGIMPSRQNKLSHEWGILKVLSTENNTGIVSVSKCFYYKICYWKKNFLIFKVLPIINLFMSFFTIFLYIILGWYQDNLGWKYCLLFNWEKTCFWTNKKFVYLIFINKLWWYNPKITYKISYKRTWTSFL